MFLYVVELLIIAIPGVKIINCFSTFKNYNYDSRKYPTSYYSQFKEILAKAKQTDLL